MSKANQSRQEKYVSQISCSWFWCLKLFEDSDLNKIVLQTGQCNVLSFYKSICWLCRMSVSRNTWFVVSNLSYIVEGQDMFPSLRCIPQVAPAACSWTPSQQKYHNYIKWICCFNVCIFQDHVTNKNTSKNAASGIWKKNNNLHAMQKLSLQNLQWDHKFFVSPFGRFWVKGIDCGDFSPSEKTHFDVET